MNLYDKLGIQRSENFLANFLQDSASLDKGNATRNVISRYFGLPRKVNDRKAGDASIRLVDRKFDLVMILERLDEGLVLLKQRLCWTMKDILYVPIAVLQYTGKNTHQLDELIVKHRRWSTIDYAMYEHFKRKLEVCMANYRPLCGVLVF